MQRRLIEQTTISKSRKEQIAEGEMMTEEEMHTLFQWLLKHWKKSIKAQEERNKKQLWIKHMKLRGF